MIMSQLAQDLLSTLQDKGFYKAGDSELAATRAYHYLYDQLRSNQVALEFIRDGAEHFSQREIKMGDQRKHSIRGLGKGAYQWVKRIHQLGVPIKMSYLSNFAYYLLYATVMKGTLKLTPHEMSLVEGASSATALISYIDSVRDTRVDSLHSSPLIQDDMGESELAQADTNEHEVTRVNTSPQVLTYADSDEPETTPADLVDPPKQKRTRRTPVVTSLS